MASNIFDNIVVRITKTLRSVDLSRAAAEAAEKIRRRTILGFGVRGEKRGAVREKIKPLSGGYIELRKQMKKDNMLSNKTTVKRSHLTRTGQMLAAIRSKYRKNRIEIFFKKGLRKKDKYEQRPYTNAEVARFHSVEEGNPRPFFELTDTELKGLQRDIKSDLIKSLKKNRRK